MNTSIAHLQNDEKETIGTYCNSSFGCLDVNVRIIIIIINPAE